MQRHKRICATPSKEFHSLSLWYAHLHSLSMRSQFSSTDFISYLSFLSTLHRGILLLFRSSSSSYLRDRAHFPISFFLDSSFFLLLIGRLVPTKDKYILYIERGILNFSLIVGDGVKFSANTIAAKVTKRWRCLLCRDKSIDRGNKAQTIKNSSIDACILEEGLIINKEYR